MPSCLQAAAITPNCTGMPGSPDANSFPVEGDKLPGI